MRRKLIVLFIEVILFSSSAHKNITKKTKA